MEYIDTLEEETVMIAMTPEDLMEKGQGYCSTYTHCEIHPAMILGEDDIPVMYMYCKICRFTYLDCHNKCGPQTILKTLLST